MRVFLIILTVFIGVAAFFVALTYPRYHREMRVRRTRLLAGSDMLKTDQGDIEYTVQGQGTPVMSLHGAGGGYDQGLWAAKMAFGEGYEIISVSRYGYLRTPIPKDASIKTQAALYKDLLDHVNIPEGNRFGQFGWRSFRHAVCQRLSRKDFCTRIAIGRE